MICIIYDYFLNKKYLEITGGATVKAGELSAHDGKLETGN